jgi:hypothetical protein
MVKNHPKNNKKEAMMIVTVCLGSLDSDVLLHFLDL